ncbi:MULTISPECIES: hypothetical protein [unclassified Microbacterium]|uniref:hypothetical protein n=1 Tax=Microbacterium TaxID=33882 RepID=UPI003BA0E0D6
MQYVEVSPEDIPDPRVEWRQKLREMPVPALTFVAQRHLESTMPSGYEQGQDGRGLREMRVSFTYTLIRDPDNRMAPGNLVEMDNDMRRSLEVASAHPRPDWLVEMTEQMRFPQLWEAVRTTWHRDHSEEASVAGVLVQHANHVLRNTFRVEHGLEGIAGGLPPAPDIHERAVQRPISLMVDGLELDGAFIDTDPHIYAIGAELPTGGIVTVVVPRDELPLITLELETVPR